MLADRLGHEKVSTTLNTYSHLFPHKQQELVSNLEQLAGAGAGNTPPEPPVGNPLLESMGIVYDDSDEASPAGNTKAMPAAYEPMPCKPATEEPTAEKSASEKTVSEKPMTKLPTHRKVIPMPQRKII